MKRLACLFLACLLLVAANRAQADTFGSGADAFDIEFVTIGNPGSAADTTGNPNPAGAVPYTYRMGKFEISEQMIDKANALGELGITKDTRGADKPATSVSWNEAARFVNWLNISSNSTPAYKFALQPGEVGFSANANIELWTTSDAGYNPSNLYRNSLARYFLPSVDEWYKAAYYDPSANGGAGEYWNFPTGSDSAPTPVASGTAAGTAVYDGQSGPADVTLAGGLSPYGTTGQGGNVWEWEETDFDLVNDSSSSARGYRGGSWIFNSNFLSSSGRVSGNPAGGSINIGFRVASIPEPSTLLLLCLGSLAVLRRRDRNAGHVPAKGLARVRAALLQPVFQLETFDKCEVGVSREQSQTVGFGHGSDLNVHIRDRTANSPQLALDTTELNRGACIVLLMVECCEKPQQVSLVLFDPRTVEHHEPQFANRWLAEQEILSRCRSDPGLEVGRLPKQPAGVIGVEQVTHQRAVRASVLSCA